MTDFTLFLMSALLVCGGRGAPMGLVVRPDSTDISMACWSSDDGARETRRSAKRDSGRIVSDEDLKKLPDYSDLEELDMHSTQVTDRGLKELARLPKLQRLDLGLTEVTDAGMAELA